MLITRGYFYKTRGNAVIRVTAQVDFLVDLQVHNNDPVACLASIQTPPSPVVGGGAAGPTNGIGFTVPPNTSQHSGPIGMLAGEEFAFQTNATNLQVFVTVRTEESDTQVAQIAMWE